MYDHAVHNLKTFWDYLGLILTSGVLQYVVVMLKKLNNKLEMLIFNKNNDNTHKTLIFIIITNKRKLLENLYFTF